MPTSQDEKDKLNDDLDPADFERRFANRAASPGFDQAQSEMDEADKKKSASPDEVKRGEEAGAGSQSGGLGSEAAGWATKLVGPEAGAALTALTALKSIFWSSKRRKRATVGGGALGVLAGVGIFGMIFISGPLELVHLAQTLEHGFSSSQHISSIRGNKLLRWATAQDVGETRLGVLGRQYLRGTVSSLESKGVTFQKNSAGNLDGVEFDLNNGSLQEKFPELKGMTTDAEKKAWLADKTGVSVDEISGSGDTFSVAKDPGIFLNATKSLLGNVIGSFGDGGALSSAMQTRTLSKYFNIPNLFHPVSRALAAKAQSLQTTADEKTLAETEQQSVIEPTETSPDVLAAEDQTDSEATDYKSTAMKSLLLVGGLCFLRSVGQDVKTMNRDLIKVPAEIEAINLIALAAQMKNGSVPASLVDGTLASLNDSSGQSVFSAESMQALEGSTNLISGKKGSLDLSPDYKQAFTTGSNSTVAKISSYINSKLKFGPLSPAQVCSTPGQLIAAAIQLSIDATATFGDVVSAGTLTPLEVAAFGAQQSESFAISTVIFHYLQTFIVNNSAVKGVTMSTLKSAAEKGNWLAYGARAAGNTVAEESGAIASAGSSLQSLVGYNQQQKQQFQSESFFARIFNIRDYRSLIGRLATSLSPSLRQNITNFASDIGSFGQIIGDAFTNLFAAIFPHASAAASTTYCWGQTSNGQCSGFPQATIPDKILNSADPTMNDPYWNACILFSCQQFTNPLTNQTEPIDGELVNLQGQQTTSFSKYSGYALTCFGDSLAQENGQWTAIPTQPVDENSDNYINDCQSTNDPIFQRLMLFTADNTTMDTMACASGDANSCSNIGF